MTIYRGRKIGVVMMALLLGSLTVAHAGGAKDFGQRVTHPINEPVTLGGAKDFGQ
ncbi:hypothetical protein [Deinococcus sp.]|uniref:hypothetical protein n=1 Tax=Deinococcus sp. TaxID=47478 RepID=UPI003B5C9950